MRLGDRRLDEWLNAPPGNSKASREKAGFARRYMNIAERLRDAHLTAVAGAVAAEVRLQLERGDEVDPGLLTDHGPDHI